MSHEVTRKHYSVVRFIDTIHAIIGCNSTVINFKSKPKYRLTIVIMLAMSFDKR